MFPANNPFWKYPQDIPNGVRTRSQEKNQKLVEKREYNRYFRKSGQYLEMVRSGRIRTMLIKRIRQILCGTMIGVVFLVIFIVNNGNIWTDGRRYRKRPKIEM